MCGIAGYCHLNKNAKDVNLREMNHRLYHRGPDDEGYYENSVAGLAMRRLSIIDLHTGQQPVSNEDNTVHVVFNGEIYNFQELRYKLIQKGHTFSTQTDTEVLVHGYEEWGRQLPKYLRGMFSFAIWDTLQQLLFIARDHFGIKPLYYAVVDNNLYFASEMKAILHQSGVGNELNVNAIDQYLSLLYIPEPNTIYNAINALPAAHTLLCQNGQISIEQYWSFEHSQNNHPTKAAAIQAIQDSFEDSVQKMLMSDVPLGVFLSGGIDSVSITSMMARHSNGKPIRSFSIGFGQREHHWDELEAAKQVAQYFSTDHHEFQIKPDVVTLLPEIIRHFDQPFANPTAILLYLLSQETQKHVKVALSGTGGDEVFAGYPRYRGMQLHEQFSRLPKQFRVGLANLASKYARDASNGFLAPQRIRRFLESVALPFDEAYISLVTIINEQRKIDLYSAEFLNKLDNQQRSFDFIKAHFRENPNVTPLNSLMAADLNTYLPFNQLMYADRMSMAHSLEVRVPFVDQKLMEVVGNIPLEWKLRHGTTKGLFREAMKPFIPDWIVNAPKQGLNLPIALWFREDLRDWVRDILSPRNLTNRGLFQLDKLEMILQEHENGYRDHSLFIWALIVLEVWHQEYLDQPVATGSYA